MKLKIDPLRYLIAGTILGLCLTSSLLAQTATNRAAFHPSRIIVKPRSGSLDQLHTQLGTRVGKRFRELGDIQVLTLPQGTSVSNAIAAYMKSGLVMYAEPDYVVHTQNTTPNDTHYSNGLQWNLHNTGQNGGTSDADIDAPEAWDVRTSASTVVIAVIDSGTRYTHEDLAANIWTNPSETAGNSTDDDGNGYVDDVHGINAITGSGDPDDDYFHGTHVAGILGAVGNNSVGIAGVAWGVKIMPLKFLDYTGYGYTSDAIECIQYAVKQRVDIINASWGGYGFDQSLVDAIALARDEGILFVAAAANATSDNDSTPVYPANIELDNIISVAATTRNDGLASYSDYGLASVHLGAPGGETGTNGIVSTYNTTDSTYAYLAGTSMAAPHVAGALALLRAQFPTETYLQLRNRVLSSTDALGALSGKAQTGGRLNLNGALNTADAHPVNNDFANALVMPPGGATFLANNAAASKQASEPNHASNSGGKSIWWNWTAPNNTTVTIQTLGSGFDTLLAVYTGSSVSGLTPVASDDNSGQGRTSKVTFTPSASTTYRIAVDGYNGASGTVKLQLGTSLASQPTALQFSLSSLVRTIGSSQFAFRVTGPTTGSPTVAIEKSTDLENWSSLTSFTLPGSGYYDYTDSGASGSSKFYRAKVSGSQNSVNIIGYVDRTMPSGQSMHSNPFNANDNRVVVLIPSPSVNSIVYKYDAGNQSYIIDTFRPAGLGWSNPNLTFLPGEAFIYFNNSGSTTVTFVGELALGYGVNTLTSAYSMSSSIIPQAGKLVKDLRLPIANGDTVDIMTSTTPTYTTYTYSGGAWSPSEPSISIGDAFWNNKGAGVDWSRNFLSWPTWP